MGIATQGTVEMLHAEREGGGECVDVAGGDVGAGERGRGGGVGGVGGSEVVA